MADGWLVYVISLSNGDATFKTKGFTRTDCREAASIHPAAVAATLAERLCVDGRFLLLLAAVLLACSF